MTSDEHPSPAGDHERRDRSGRRRRPPLDWAAEAGAADEIWRETQVKVGRRVWRRLVLAGAASVVAAILFTQGSRMFLSPAPENAPATAAAELAAGPAVVLTPELRTLEDGSVVELKPGAEIRATYTDTARRITLVRGEAHFAVAKNAARPFIVRAGGVDVRAVGTAFAVELASREVDVLVTEGRVAVERAPEEANGDPDDANVTPAAAGPTFVDAGQRAVVANEARVSTEPSVAAITAVEIGARLAWRVPRLEFTRTPLAEALPLINQYSCVHVGLDDMKLGQLRISGLLRADNLETLLNLLEAEYHLRIEWRGPDEVVLHRGS